MARFREQYPQAHVRLIDGNRREILTLLEHGAAGLAIMGRTPEGMQAEALPFADRPYVIIAAPDHRLAGRTGLSLEDLAGEDFILREEGSGSRRPVEDCSKPRV